MDKRLDNYAVSFRDESQKAKTENDFISEVTEMEDNSRWIEGVDSKSISIDAIDGPIFARDYAEKRGLDEDLAWDTSQSSMLAISYTESNGTDVTGFIRDTARAGLIYNVAGLGGSKVSKVSASTLAACANMFIHDEGVSSGQVLILNRYGKISGVHSNAGGGYAVMPISQLIDITRDSLRNNFGDADFFEGYNSHGFTSAAWTLPEAQSDILDIYRDAMGTTTSSFSGLNFMPGVRLETSDTSNCCATLAPVFYTAKQHEFRFVDGITVRHTKRVGPKGLAGMDLFEAESKDIFAMFKNAGEVIKKLCEITIYNGENCVISLCNRYGISKKYGDTPRAMVERICSSGRGISAHDLYLCMTAIIPYAEKIETPERTVRNLREAIAKIPGADWKAHDVGGKVAWA